MFLNIVTADFLRLKVNEKMRARQQRSDMFVEIFPFLHVHAAYYPVIRSYGSYARVRFFKFRNYL